MAKKKKITRRNYVAVAAFQRSAGAFINKKKRAISRVGYYLFIDNSVIYDLEFYNYL